MTIYTAYMEDLKDADLTGYSVITLCQNVPEDSETVNFASLVPGKGLCSYYEATRDQQGFLRGYFDLMLKPLVLRNDTMLARMLEIAGSDKLLLARHRHTGVPDFFDVLCRTLVRKYGVDFQPVRFRTRVISDALF